ncbi:PEPxxWA-CTERM sorting domain-containing protein [Sphingomonas sp. RS2018]
MFTVANSAAAAVTVNFSFNGTYGTAPGIVNGKLIFNTTGTNVAASEIYIVSAPSGTIDTGSLNKNLLTNAISVTNNAFTVSNAGIVTAANLGFSTQTTFGTYIDLNNANNGNASQLYNYNTGRYALSLDGFAGLTFTPVAAVTTAVPEPATWAMMMLGFGGIGFAMRRRSTVTTRIRFA